MIGSHAPAEGRAVWQGFRIDYRREGMHALSADEIAEIDAALRHLRSLGEVDYPEITPDSFPLPTLGPFFVISATSYVAAGASFCCPACRANVIRLTIRLRPILATEVISASR